MNKKEAFDKLKLLNGVDIRSLAEEYEVTINKGNKTNKGWFGHVIERYLGLPINSAQSPNFGSWELKTTTLKILKNGLITPKETLAITMIDPFNVKNTTFEESHLLSKLKKMLICLRIDIKNNSKLVDVISFDLDDRKMLHQIKEDYEKIRERIANSGFESLTGKMGIIVQPRTKGAGHGSKTRAFYIRRPALKNIITEKKLTEIAKDLYEK